MNKDEAVKAITEAIQVIAKGDEPPADKPEEPTGGWPMRFVIPDDAKVPKGWPS